MVIALSMCPHMSLEGFGNFRFEKIFICKIIETGCCCHEGMDYHECDIFRNPSRFKQCPKKRSEPETSIKPISIMSEGREYG